MSDYGLILDNSGLGITRAVRMDGGWMIQEFTGRGVAEITLTQEQIDRLALASALPTLAGTVLEHIHERWSAIELQRSFDGSIWLEMLRREGIDPDAEWEEAWDLVLRAWPEFDEAGRPVRFPETRTAEQLREPHGPLRIC